MIRLDTHIVAVAIAIALPLILLGKISESTTQVTGPQDMANPAMYTRIKIDAALAAP